MPDIARLERHITPRLANTLATVARSSFPALAFLYASLFAAFGTESPFFPLFLSVKGLGSNEIASVLSAGTIVRISLGPFIGVAADRAGVRLALALASVGAGAFGLGYLPTRGFAALLSVSLLHAAAVTGLNPLADALAIAAAKREGAFPYGWVRGIGSVAFVIATLVSGFVIGTFGLNSVVIVSSVLFLAMLVALPRLKSAPPPATSTPPLAGFVELLGIAPYRRLLLVAGLVIGSQSMADAFAVIHWRSAGVAASVTGVLWSEAVSSEALVFLVVGPILLRRLGTARCATLAASAGIVQWGALATTVSPAILAVTQPLHGLTFALTHLVAMRVISDVTPLRLAATAQALYGTLSLGIASAVLTMLSGLLYGSFGANGFWSMSMLCLAAIPFARGLSSGGTETPPT